MLCCVSVLFLSACAEQQTGTTQTSQVESEVQTIEEIEFVEAVDVLVAPQQAYDSALAVETFDFVWEKIRDTHFDPDLNGIDWEVVRIELRPQAQTATSNGDLRATLADMISRFGQSHFSLIPAEQADALSGQDDEDDKARDANDAASNTDTPDQQPQLDVTHNQDSDTKTQTSKKSAKKSPKGPGEVGLDLRLLDGQCIVTAVEPGSSADIAGVKPGWLIEDIRGKNPEDLLEQLPDDLSPGMRGAYYRQGLIGRLNGRIGSTVKAQFRDARKQVITIAFRRGEAKGIVSKFGNLPPIPVFLDSRWVQTPNTDTTSRIGLISFNMWLLPIMKPFAEAVDEFRDADGIILDLRGNPGGVGAMAMGLAGHFINDKKLSLGTLKTRDTELKFVINPRRVSTKGKRVKPFAGPVAILIDGESASTSEIFAGGMHGLGRVRVFGTPSAGAALPAMLTRLPNNDVLLHAYADFLDPNGKTLEGIGVVPDQHINLTRDALLDEIDAPLEAAIEWINTQSEIGWEYDSTPYRPKDDDDD